jgi:hypothetical protein
MMKKILILLALLIALPMSAQAQTPCDEWANMTKILVMRWQNDDAFKNRTLTEVQNELRKSMGNHPEIDKANKWLAYAHKRREDDPVRVWKDVYAQCKAVMI